MDIAGNKFVVIGGAGLIGSHTVDLLIANDAGEVVIYDNFTRGSRDNIKSALADSRVSVFELGGDITQPDILNEALVGADGVFHFAALWLLHCHDYPQSAFAVNVAGTFNVLEACRTQGVGKLVYSSSASVYGDAVEEPMSEDHPFNNTTFYGATKIAGEAMVTAYHHRYEFDAIGLRYMNVYGPRQDYRGAYVAVVMKMLDNIDQGLPLRVHGDGSQAYDFVHVTDCAKANIAAMTSATPNGFYNVGTGRRTSISQLAEMLLELTGSDVGVEYEPAGLTFVRNRIGDPKRASVDLGFDSTVELREGLESLIEWRNADKERLDLVRARSSS